MPENHISANDIRSRGTVISLCYSEILEGPKKFIERALFVEEGVSEAEKPSEVWCQNVEILSWKTVTKLMERDYHYEFGQCGKKLCITSADLASVKTGDVLFVGKAVLVVTHMGMSCQSRCSIRENEPDDCPASREWIFARILRGGQVLVEDIVVAMSSEKSAGWKDIAHPNN